MALAPTLRVISPNAPLQDFASAISKSTCPCRSVHFIGDPFTYVTPVQLKLKSSISSTLSIAAAAVTVLNVEPGVSLPDRNVLKYSDELEFVGSDPLGSTDGVHTMAIISPVL